MGKIIYMTFSEIWSNPWTQTNPVSFCHNLDRRMKNSLLWLAEFLAGNFYLACNSCAAIGGKPQLVFQECSRMMN